MRFSSQLIGRIIWPYAPIVALSFGAVWLVYEFIGPLSESLDNTRYLLSSTIQAQAAVIAIVLSLTLVAVQLSSSSYSARTIGLFKRLPDTWVLLCWYLLSISGTAYLLQTLSPATPDVAILSVHASLVAGLLALFPYALTVMKILTPEVIMKQLAAEIPVSLRAVDEDGFQPLRDIVMQAYLKHDHSAVRQGISEMTEKGIQVVENYDSSGAGRRLMRTSAGVTPVHDVYSSFARHYCIHIEEIGRMIARENEPLTVFLIEKVNVFRDKMTEKGVRTERVLVHVIETIADVSLDSGFRDAARSAMESLGHLGVSIQYRDIGVDVSREEGIWHTEVANQVVDALDRVGVRMTKEWGLLSAHNVGRILDEVSETMVENGLVWGAVAMARAINDVGMAALAHEENWLDEQYMIMAHRFVEPLECLASRSFEKGSGMEPAFERAVVALWDIGIASEIQGFTKSAMASAKALAHIASYDRDTVNETLERLLKRERLPETSPSVATFKDRFNFFLDHGTEAD